MSKSILGIDVSKETLDICLMHENKKHHLEIDNNRQGFKTLNKWLRKHKVKHVHATMEATGAYYEAIAEYLYRAGHQVSVVNPFRIKKYGESLGMRNKTDKLDAWVIADFCRSQKDLLFWSPPDPAIRELRTVVRHLQALKAMRYQQNNRLKSGATSALTRRSLKKTIRFLDKEIKSIQMELSTLVQAHPEIKRLHDLIVSIPGIGHLTACTLIAEIQDITMFEHPKQLAAYAGVTPSQHQSGSSINGKSRMSKKGNAHLRASLFFPALVAKRHNPIVKAAADRHIARGNCKMSATGVAMRQLLHIVWGVWTFRKPFDPYRLRKLPISS